MAIPPLYEPKSKPRTKLWIALVVMTAATLALGALTIGPSPPHSIRMATGQSGGGYAMFGEKYKERLKRRGLDVQLIESNGSIDNLNKLLRGEADVAFVQGGTYPMVDDADHKLRGLVALYLEPLWVFYKGDVVQRVGDFQGKSISIGPKGSGTEAIGRELLSKHGIEPTNPQVVNLRNADARKGLEAGTLDVAFFVGSYEDANVLALLANKKVQLMNFQRHDTAHSRQFPYLQPVKVAEGLINLKDNVPREEVTLLAPAALLVCREDLHPNVVEQILKTARAIHAPGNLLDAPNSFPTLAGVDVAIHESAETYVKSGESALSRLLPYWGVRLIYQGRILLLPLLAVWLPFLKIVPMIYNYRVNALLKKHYLVLRDVEDSITQATNSVDLRDRIEILDRLREAMESLTRKVPAHLQRDVYNWRLHVAMVQDEALKRLESMTGAEKKQGADSKVVGQPVPVPQGQA